MDRSKVTLIAGVLTLVVAVFSLNTTFSPTTAAIAGGSSGSLTIAAIALILAVALFSKYFGFVK
jgi:hypothetical protein